MSIISPLIRAWRELPVTASFIAAAGIMLVLVQAVSGLTGLSEYAARERLGTVAHEFWPGEPSLYGPFSLWSGQWWRILVSAFHHGGWLYGSIHFGLNGMSMWYLGVMLEPHLPWYKYGIFLLLACYVSLLPEFWLGNYAIGLSGAIYAMFGAAIVLRKRDPLTAEILTWPVVIFGLAFLGLCEIINRLDWVRIANTAHIAGLLYGWIAGVVLLSPTGKRRVVRYVFYAAHLLLIPATHEVMFPDDSARFAWYQAKTAENPEQRLVALQRAAARDPKLANRIRVEHLETLVKTGRVDEAIRRVQRRHASHPGQSSWWPLLIEMLARHGRRSDAQAVIELAAQEDPQHQSLWLSLANFHLQRGEVHTAIQTIEFAEKSVPRHGGFWWQFVGALHAQGKLELAWRMALEGVKRYPETSLGKWMVGQLWLEMPTAEKRQQALEILEDVFAKDAKLWRMRLGLDPHSPQRFPMRLGDKP